MKKSMSNLWLAPKHGLEKHGETEESLFGTPTWVDPI